MYVILVVLCEFNCLFHVLGFVIFVIVYFSTETRYIVSILLLWLYLSGDLFIGLVLFVSMCVVTSPSFILYCVYSYMSHVLRVLTSVF